MHASMPPPAVIHGKEPSASRTFAAPLRRASPLFPPHRFARSDSDHLVGAGSAPRV